jgi:hypothetical protein
MASRTRRESSLFRLCSSRSASRPACRSASASADKRSSLRSSGALTHNEELWSDIREPSPPKAMASALTAATRRTPAAPRGGGSLPGPVVVPREHGCPDDADRLCSASGWNASNEIRQLAALHGPTPEGPRRRATRSQIDRGAPAGGAPGSIRTRDLDHGRIAGAGRRGPPDCSPAGTSSSYASNPFSAATRPYQRADSFGVRSPVAKSTQTRPKRCS